MKKIIEFKDFTFKYQAQQEPTLKDIQLTIYQGEKVLIIGPSGSGKSTIGQCLNGIIPNIYKGEHSGSLLLDGQEALIIQFMISPCSYQRFFKIQMVNSLAYQLPRT